MALMYAGVEAVAEQWRPLDSRESAVAIRLLDRVSALMRRYAPGLDVRVSADSDLAVVAAGVAVDAVLRVMRSLAFDPNATANEKSGPEDASLHLTDVEIASLLGDSDDRLGSGAFTIRPTGHASSVRCSPWR